MNKLVGMAHRILNKSEVISFRSLYAVGLMIGKGFDLAAAITDNCLAISFIRVKNSVQIRCLTLTVFVAPVPMVEALERTVRHEFVESYDNESVFCSG